MTKEIDFNAPGCSDTLISGLNFYSQHHDFKDSKRWALDWIKVHLPDEYKRLEGAKEHQFSNRGFVCRMLKNGLKLDDTQKHDLIKFFLNMNTSTPVQDAPEPAPKRKPAEKVNEVIFQLDDVIDAILSDQEPKPVTIPVDKNQLTDARAWLEKQIVETQEQVAKHQAILAQLVSAYDRCGGIKDKITKPVTPTKVIEDTKTVRANAAKTMKFKKKDEELGLESLSPARIVGAKEALLYNTKRRQILRYVASPGTTLSVAHSSIRNFDEQKSTCKIIRKPKDLFAVKDVWAAYELVKTTSRCPGAHVSEDVVIVSVR